MTPYTGNEEEEWITLTPPGVGWCYVRVSQSTNDPNAWGPESDYDLSVDITVGAALIVVAVDRLNTSHSPPGTYVTIDNGSPEYFINDTNCLTIGSLSLESIPFA